MKNFKSFFSGVFAMALAVSLIGTAAAASGKLQIGTAGVVVMDKMKVEPGAEYTANSVKIPAVVTYEDVTGKPHHYLPVEMMNEYFNIPITWSEARNSVVLGSTMENAQLETHIYREGDERPKNPSTPTLGKTVGPFTEIAPSTVDTSQAPSGIDDDQTRVQTVTGYTTGGYYIPENGKYVVLTVTNNGQTPITCLAGRNPVLGIFERFPSVDVEPGRTLTRAFVVADGTPEEQSGFNCVIRGADPRDPADVTVSLKQYK